MYRSLKRLALGNIGWSQIVSFSKITWRTTEVQLYCVKKNWKRKTPLCGKPFNCKIIWLSRWQASASKSYRRVQLFFLFWPPHETVVRPLSLIFLKSINANDTRYPCIDIFAPPFAYRQKLLTQKNIQTERILLYSSGFIVKSFLALMNTSLSKSKTKQNKQLLNCHLPPGGFFQKNLGGSVRFLKLLTYFRPKFVIFPTLFQAWSKIWYPILDLTLKSIPYFAPAL